MYADVQFFTCAAPPSPSAFPSLFLFSFVIPFARVPPFLPAHVAHVRRTPPQPLELPSPLPLK